MFMLLLMHREKEVPQTNNSQNKRPRALPPAQEESSQGSNPRILQKESPVLMEETNIAGDLECQQEVLTDKPPTVKWASSSTNQGTFSYLQEKVVWENKLFIDFGEPVK